MLLRRLYALNLEGVIGFQKDFNEDFGDPVISPNNSILVIGTANISENSIVGFSAASGTEAWRETLPLENGMVQFITTRARFTPDGQTVYLHTATADGQNSRSFLYAISSAKKDVD